MSDAHRDEIAKLEALYEENPEGRVFTHLAEAYRKAGELERAREVLTEGIERHPDYSSAHVVLGRVLRGLDREAEAESEFLRVLELDNHNLIALRALGDLARDRGDHPTALSYYERLVELEPSDEVQEVIAELTGGVPVGEEPAGAEADLDPWAAVPADHERPDPTETDHGGEPEPWAQEPEPEHELMDISAYGGDEADGGEVGEADWSTEVEPGADEDEYAGWVGGTAEDQSGDVGFDEAGPGSEEADGAGPAASELAAGGGPWVSGAPDEGRDDEASSDDTAGVTTETIAQVYARQGLYDRAADVYRELLRSRPDDEGLRDRLAEMEQLATAREERPAEEPMAVSGEAGTDDDEAALEGFETEEVDLGAADAEPIAGLEVQDADPETGLIVEATPDQVDVEDRSEELGVTDVPRPPEDSPWAPAEEEMAEPVTSAEAEDDTLGSVWTGSDWGEAAEAETPHAWAEDEGEPDETPPIRDYFGGLLSWSGGGGSAPADAAETVEPEAADAEAGSTEPHGQETDVAETEAGSSEPPASEAAPSTEPSGTRAGEDEDDDDLDMFRSWLESLKQ